MRAIFVTWSQLIYILIILVVNYASAALANEVSDLTVKAKNYYRQGELDAAMECFDKLIELGDTDAYLGRGLTYFHKMDYEKAIADLDKTIQLKPIPYAFEIRGDVYSRESNHAKAVDDYTESIKLNPKKAEVYVSRAEQNLFQSYYDPALIDCNTAIFILSDAPKANELLVRAYVTRGIIFERKSQYERAFDDYDNAIRLDTNNAAAYNGRGLMLFWKGEYSQAISDCQKAIRLAPNQSSAYDRMAWILAVCPDGMFRDGQKSLENAKKACDMASWKNPVYLITLGTSYAEIGNYDEAIKWAEKSVELGIPQEYMEEVKKQLDLYKQNKPYHVEPAQTK
jgi:tetratricopeptide (TPR) repeat protein